MEMLGIFFTLGIRVAAAFQRFGGFGESAPYLPLPNALAVAGEDALRALPFVKYVEPFGANTQGSFHTFVVGDSSLVAAYRNCPAAKRAGERTCTEAHRVRRPRILRFFASVVANSIDPPSVLLRRAKVLTRKLPEFQSGVLQFFDLRSGSSIAPTYIFTEAPGDFDYVSPRRILELAKLEDAWAFRPWEFRFSVDEGQAASRPTTRSGGAPPTNEERSNRVVMEAAAAVQDFGVRFRAKHNFLREAWSFKQYFAGQGGGLDSCGFSPQAVMLRVLEIDLADVEAIKRAERLYWKGVLIPLVIREMPGGPPDAAAEPPPLFSSSDWATEVRDALLATGHRKLRLASLSAGDMAVLQTYEFLGVQPAAEADAEQTLREQEVVKRQARIEFERDGGLRDFPYNHEALQSIREVRDLPVHPVAWDAPPVIPEERCTVARTFPVPHADIAMEIVETLADGWKPLTDLVQGLRKLIGEPGGVGGVGLRNRFDVFGAKGYRFGDPDGLGREAPAAAGEAADPPLTPAAVTIIKNMISSIEAHVSDDTNALNTKFYEGPLSDCIDSFARGATAVAEIQNFIPLRINARVCPASLFKEITSLFKALVDRSLTFTLSLSAVCDNVLGVSRPPLESVLTGVATRRKTALRTRGGAAVDWTPIITAPRVKIEDILLAVD